MNLVPWKNKRNGEGSELAPVSEFRREMDRLFDSFFRGMDDDFGSLTPWAPALDVNESDTEITVRAEIPGVEPKDLDLAVTGKSLVISGEKRESTEKKSGGVLHRESRYGSFRRAVPLSTEVDADKVAAEFKNGVLTVRLQKSPAAMPKRIAIKS